MNEIFSTILFLIAVLDPIGSVPVYLEATKHFDEKHKRKVALRASVVAFLILLVFIVLGQIVFRRNERFARCIPNFRRSDFVSICTDYDFR